MHKLHHHYQRPYAKHPLRQHLFDLDRLFGTFVYDDPKKIGYGLDILEDPKDEHIVYQFEIPFDKLSKTDY